MELKDIKNIKELIKYAAGSISQQERESLENVSETHTEGPEQSKKQTKEKVQKRT